MKKTIFAVMILALLTACGPTSYVPTPDPGSPPNDSFVASSCATIYSSAPWGVNLKGSVVLNDYKTTSHLFMLNLENDAQIDLATLKDTVSDIVGSPDGKSVGYKLGHPETNSWSFVVADVQGKRTADAVWPNGFFVLGGWVNNQEILLLGNPAIVALNPYTKQQKHFSFSDLPGYQVDPTGNRIAFLDPAVERAVYKNDQDKISLLDIPNKKVLAQVDNHPAPSAIAAWAQDGSRVAVVGTITLSSKAGDKGDDIFGISRDGEVKRLSHLVDHFGKLALISPSGLRWSPNGRYIAFWLGYPQSSIYSWELAVVDTTTQKTTTHCIINAGESNLTAIHPLAAPIWSQDGNQLLVESRDVKNKDANRVLILDIAKNAAYQVAENMYPAAWLGSGTP